MTALSYVERRLTGSLIGGLGSLVGVEASSFLLFFLLFLGHHLLLSLEVVLGKIAVLALPSRVVRSLWMWATVCFLAFASSVVAVVAHVLGVVLAISMGASVNLLADAVRLKEIDALLTLVGSRRQVKCFVCQLRDVDW